MRNSGSFDADLIEMRSSHVADSPALVRDRLPDLLEQLILHFCRGELLGDRDQVLHGEQPYGVLIVTLKAAINGQPVTEYMRFGEFLNKCLCGKST